MATFAVIIGIGIVGLVVTQLGITTVGAILTLARERKVRQLSQLLWWERVETAHAVRAQRQLSTSAWNGYRKFVVAKREVEADGVCSFYLSPHDGKRLPHFNPGQYLTFRIAMPDQPQALIRCYSLSDAPHPDQYRVTVKRVAAPRDGAEIPAGLVSNYFHDQVNEGCILDVKAPSGHFVLDQAERRPAVLIGGGVGVTPLLSMLQTVAESGSDREVWLFYGVRNGREHAMREDLRALHRRHDNLHVVTCYSCPSDEDVQGRDYDESGHLSVEMLRKYLRDRDSQPINNQVFYLCGPPPMMKSLLSQLQAWGVPKADVHTEAFGPASVKAREKPKAVAATKPEVGEKKFQVTFAKSGKQLTWNEEFSNLLEFASHEGVHIDSACCAGGCGTCKVAVKSGVVAYDETPECEVEEGCCLACVGRPQGDLVLDA